MGMPYRAGVTQPRFDAKVARLAAAQHGVFAREQVTRLGATKGTIQHRLATGRWERLSRDVFGLSGTPPTWRRALMAACLVWGVAAVVSHRAAAALWRLAGFEPGAVELTVPRERRGRGPGIVHRSRVPPPDATIVDAIPVTTVARTLIDIAAVAPPEAVEEALDDALRRGLVTVSRLRWRISELAPRGGRRGVAALRSLVEARGRDAIPGSVFETRLLRLLKRAGLADPEIQHPIRHEGRLIAVVDLAYPDARLGIEADGYRWHSSRQRWEHDRARRNELTRLGWRIIHVTWRELQRAPESVVAGVRAALTDRPSDRARS